MSASSSSRSDAGHAVFALSPETVLALGSRLSIEVFCRAPTAKKQGKATPLCFAPVPLSGVLKKLDSNSHQRQRRVEHEVALIRVNAPRGKPALAAAQKCEAPKLILRIHAPETPLSPQLLPPATLPESTAVNEDAPVAHSLPCVVDFYEASDQESDTVVPTDCEAGPSTAKAPALTSSGKPRGNLRKRSVDTSPVTSAPAPASLPDDVTVASQHERQPGAGPLERQEDRRSSRTWLQFAESCVNYVGPYDELREAEEQSDDHQMEAVLARLVSEWQAVGQMLIGLAAVNTAVIGFVRGSTAFTIDDFSLGAVTIGAIAAGLGVAMDAWFFLLFSGADAAKFKRLAKDVYGTYFFFCLVCRLPTIHMFVSVLAVGLFLLSTAWTL
ncbi:hypothetical protein GSI_05736 [Ganoderma sinense ZZ0214-1]|uniref:Uncharacterized protein n=1 Tax=Ganoderma sinense ZZ0214-1 TaxID=1077348 RepID=A0A2G8SBA6_9APHY|nr:hypothetical protein GSI_05736 [Ganoderma sinense ZZ0214-1]